MRRRLTFAISADYARHTGGWVYDQRLVDGLAAAGWAVERLVLPAGFPQPNAAARLAAAEAIAALPTGRILLIDQLCLSVMPEVAAREGRRLPLVPIVHHPLAAEDGSGVVHPVAQAERGALAHACLVVVTSPLTATTLVADYGVPAARIVTAEPGIDRLPRSLGSGGQGCRLLAVGAVVPRKDHGLLITALAGLAGRRWTLDIMGDLERAPAHVASVRAGIAAAGLDGRIRFLGTLEGTTFESAWNRADLFVATSRHEGYGMALAEALVRGLPVVTTDAGAVGGWIDHDAALVVASGDAAALRAALARAIDDPGLRRRMAEAAWALGSRMPSWRETAATVARALVGLA